MHGARFPALVVQFCALGLNESYGGVEKFFAGYRAYIVLRLFMAYRQSVGRYVKLRRPG
jgi:hypothetical protein